MDITITVPAGTYVLGDPCYSVGDDEWMPLLESCGYFCEEGSPIGTLPDGQHVYAFGTAYGDGLYTDQFGHKFGVDAGLIGLVPTTAVKQGLSSEVTTVTFFEPTECSTDGETLTFGPHVIPTGDEADDDDWDY